MNDNACDLLLPNGSRSNRLKSGTSEVCFVHRFYPEIAGAAGSKAPDPGPEPLNQPLWHDLIVRAGVIPSQTASPESGAFRYFAL
jgi:hypothetical protein